MKDTQIKEYKRILALAITVCKYTYVRGVAKKIEIEVSSSGTAGIGHFHEMIYNILM